MRLEEASELLKPKLREYVEMKTVPSKGKGMYVCPVCRSGEGPHHTGAFSIDADGTHWKCFSCGRGGDIFDLIKEREGIGSYPDQVKFAGDLFGIDVEDPEPVNTYTPRYEHTHMSIHTKEEPADYTAFFLQANKDIDKTTYHRGISLDTLNRFKVGYVEAWKHPKTEDNQYIKATPRLIIPTSKESYLARDTREQVPEDQKQYTKSKVGSTHIFNLEALKTADRSIYVVEGELDALSIIDVGGEAIGLGSISQKNKFIEAVKKDRPADPLIIALDNDKKGKEGAKELIKALKDNGIPCYQADPYNGAKDANMALMKDREAFKKEVMRVYMTDEELQEADRKEYLKTSTANYIKDFIQGISESADTPAISTGFKKLDEELDGGLYEGLYVIGGIASLGKTSLTLQIADQIAEAGHDVLIFSLEMARTELMSKSISRITLKTVNAEGGDTRNAKTARGITTGARYKNYSKEEKNLISRSVKQYGEYARHIFIHEGVGNIGTDYIRKTIDRHIFFTGNKPVVFIDYIQVLAPQDIRATDKQNTDKAVLELKRISRDFKIPVFGISSFNRASYSNEVAMDAFKESGSLEYGSDVLIGLQLEGAGKKEFDSTKAKTENPRKIELVILKNRNGKTGAKIQYSYYPAFNYFIE